MFNSDENKYEYPLDFCKYNWIQTHDKKRIERAFELHSGEISISVEDIDFTDEFTDAVERKQVASQNKLAAETEQAQKTMEEQAAADRAVISAKAKAEQDIIAANAELEVTKIQAEAALYAGEKEAEMNKRIAESLTPNLVKYYYIKQWEGVLPKTVLGESNSFMINLEQ